MALQPWRKGIIISMKDLNVSTRSFFIQVPELTEFDFIPGQFVTLDLPIHEKINKRLRSYSIASSPDQTNIFELCVETNNIGSGSAYLLNEVNIGSEITFRGPAGVFTFKDQINKTSFFICESTGVIPFISMLRTIATGRVFSGKIYLVYGGKFKNDLLYHEEFSFLEKQIAGFHYIPVLSSDKWDGKSGTVHEVYEGLILSENNSNEISSAIFYVCGWKELVDETKKRLQGIGVDKNDILQELYG
jgi:glycine betaine catabolism B